MSSRFLPILVLVAVASASISACGLTGDLYLPQEDELNPPPEASQQADDDGAAQGSSEGQANTEDETERQ